MRAVIIRWIALGQREMQNYEPIMADGQWELLGVGSRRPDHDLSALSFPVVQPVSLDWVALSIPGFEPLVRRLTGLRIENLNYMFNLEKHLQGADLVDLAETYHPFGYQAAKAKQKFGYKLVVSVQENIPFTHENPGFRKRTKQAVFQAADHFFTLSTMAKKSLVLEGVAPEKISVMPTMSVNTRYFCPADKDPDWLRRLGLSHDDFVLLFVGRLVWSKGVFDMLWAFKLLILDAELRGKPLKLLMVGNGEEWDALNAMLDQLGLRDVVRMVQRVNYPDMPTIHNLADIFVLPSIPTPKWQEQFGAVLAESMASAKPVVGSASGAIPEVIGPAGLIAHANDYTSLAEQLKTLILDDEQRQRLGKLARERAVAEFDSQVISARVRAAFDAVMNQ